VWVEYDAGEVDRFIAVADAVEERFPSVPVEGDESATRGAFEVSLDTDPEPEAEASAPGPGEGRAVVFSALGAGGRLPEAEEVVEALLAAAPGLAEE